MLWYYVQLYYCIYYVVYNFVPHLISVQSNHKHNIPASHRNKLKQNTSEVLTLLTNIVRLTYNERNHHLEH